MKVVYLTSNLNPATPSLDLIWIRHFEINILNYLKTIISYLNRADSVRTDLELSHTSATVHVMLARLKRGRKIFAFLRSHACSQALRISCPPPHLQPTPNQYGSSTSCLLMAFATWTTAVFSRIRRDLTS